MPVPRFRVTYIGEAESQELRLRPREQMRIERDTGEPLFTEGDMAVTRIYRMAWYAAGKPDTFDVWIENVDDIEMVDPDEVASGGEEAPPTSATESPD